VVTFDVQIDAHSELAVQIYWQVKTRTVWGNPYFFLLPGSKEIHWHFSYLIIGRSSWNRNIEDVNLTFDLRTPRFRNYELLIQDRDYPYGIDFSAFCRSHGLEREQTHSNEIGLDVISIHFSNFSFSSLPISLSGENKVDIEKPWQFCSFYIIVIALISGLFYRKLKTKIKRKAIKPLYLPYIPYAQYLGMDQQDVAIQSQSTTSSLQLPSVPSDHDENDRI